MWGADQAVEFLCFGSEMSRMSSVVSGDRSQGGGNRMFLSRR